MAQREHDLDIGSMMQPFTEAGVFSVEGYDCWDPCIIQGDDGRYYLAYSRWARKGGHWLTTSEIALAVGDRPEGPYRHLTVLLRGRGAGHWDELMACNPKLRRFGDKYCLYYISSRQGPTQKHIRDSQRTGVAIAESITGPYTPLDRPILEPSPPVYNVTVNPDVTRMTDGRYLMIVKGDIKPTTPFEPMPQRVQGLAIADSPAGPFRMLPELAIRDIDTEDACLWHDDRRGKYYAVFHAHTYIGLIESPDGRAWRRAEHWRITGNELRRADGTVLEVPGSLQRPDVFLVDGEPRILALAVPEPGNWHCVLVPLRDHH